MLQRSKNQTALRWRVGPFDLGDLGNRVGPFRLARMRAAIAQTSGQTAQ